MPEHGQRALESPLTDLAQRKAHHPCAEGRCTADGKAFIRSSINDAPHHVDFRRIKLSQLLLASESQVGFGVWGGGSRIFTLTLK